MEKIESWLNTIQNIEAIILPDNLRDKLERYDELLGNNEYNLFCKVKIKDGYLIPDSEPIVYPQEIDYMFVRPLWLPHDGYWMLIHKHPCPFIRFSGNDAVYFNTYPFIMSILWCCGTFICGQNMAKKIDVKNIIEREIKGLKPAIEGWQLESKPEWFPIISDKRIPLDLSWLDREVKITPKEDLVVIEEVENDT